MLRNLIKFTNLSLFWKRKPVHLGVIKDQASDFEIINKTEKSSIEAYIDKMFGKMGLISP